MIESTTFFSRCADRSSFVIDGDRLYQFSDRRQGSDNLRVGEACVWLVPGPLISDIEKFESERCRVEVDRFMKSYAATTLRQDFKSMRDRSASSRVSNALQFVLFEALPLMIDTAYELGDLLGVVPKVHKSGREVIDELVSAEKRPDVDKRAEVRLGKQELIKDLRAKNNLVFGNRLSEKSVLWGEVLGGSPVFVSDNLVYSLSRREGPLCVNNSKYSLSGRMESVGRVESVYKSALRGRILIRVIEECDEQSLESEVSGEFVPFANKTEFSLNNLGFTHVGDAFFLWYKLPKFAMQNPVRPDVYHPFSETRVGVRVNWSDGHIWQAGRAVIVDPINHPFLRDWSAQYQDICILDNRDYGSSAEGVVKQLSRGISAFMNGLTHDSLRSHGSVSEEAEYFGRSLKGVFAGVGSLTREEAVAQGYRITNEWVINGQVIT